MKRAGLLISICLTVGVLVVANWLVGRAASNSVPRQTMHAINGAGPVIDVLALGNSLVQSGFDAPAVEEMFKRAGRPAVAVNAGLGSTSSIQHLALARLALRQHTVRDLLYGFSDQQMTPEARMKNSDLIGNFAMLYYQEPQLALQYAGFDPVDRLEFQIYRCCALLRERSNIWAKVEKLRRAMQDLGMPRKETNQFGRVADMNLLEASDPNEFARRCEKVMRLGDFLSAPVHELLREATAAGSRVTVVEMPMSPSHVARFYDQPIWKEFQERTLLAVKRAGGVYIDASRWIPEEAYFQDHVHLDRPGATLFSRRLAEEMLRAH